MTNNCLRYYLKNESGDFLMIEDKILEFDTLSAVASFISEVREDREEFFLCRQCSRLCPL